LSQAGLVLILGSLHRSRKPIIPMLFYLSYLSYLLLPKLKHIDAGMISEKKGLDIEQVTSPQFSMGIFQTFTEFCYMQQAN